MQWNLKVCSTLLDGASVTWLSPLLTWFMCACVCTCVFVCACVCVCICVRGCVGRWVTVKVSGMVGNVYNLLWSHQIHYKNCCSSKKHNYFTSQFTCSFSPAKKGQQSIVQWRSYLDYTTHKEQHRRCNTEYSQVTLLKECRQCTAEHAGAVLPRMAWTNTE